MRVITTNGVLTDLSSLLSRSFIVDSSGGTEAEHEPLPLPRLHRIGVPSQAGPVQVKLQVSPSLSHVQRYNTAQKGTEGINLLQSRKGLPILAVYRNLPSAQGGDQFRMAAELVMYEE